MNSEGTKLLDDGVLVFDGRINHPTIEGPKMYKRNGYYYIFAPAGGVPTGWQMEARSKNIYGPYEHKVVLHQGNTNVNGPHQGGLVDLDDGSSWFVHFQDADAYGRITHLQPAKWVDDWCKIGVDINNDKVGEPDSEYKKPIDGYPAQVPVDDDDFDGDKLGLQWQWQAHENKAAYEIADSRLRLFSLPFESEKNILADTPHLLTQLIHYSDFDVTAKVGVNLTEGDSFGLVITGGSYTGIRIEKANGKTFAKQVNYILKKSDDTIEEVSECREIEDFTQIYLRLKVESPCVVTSYYSFDGNNWCEIGSKTRFEVSKRSWVGGKTGIFSVNMTGKNNGGYADFEYIRFNVGE
jgi:beta-xylosidase